MCNNIGFVLVLNLILLNVQYLIAGSIGQEPIERKALNAYGVIVDCGSSGTRAHLFDWNPHLKYPELLHDIDPTRDKNNKPIYFKLTPGLSSIKDDPSAASEYMKPVIEFIASHIPEESHKITSIYFLGTAGMRMLSEQVQLDIMNDIANEIRAKYNFGVVKTRVISGASEGMYQWITVNSELKRFFQNSDTNTVGIIEMGGASTQVTYQLRQNSSYLSNEALDQLPDASEAFLQSIVSPELSRDVEGFQYRLVSVTFLGFGSNSARVLYVDYLISKRLQQSEMFGIFFNNDKKQEQNKQENFFVRDACLPRGAQQTFVRPIRMLHKNSKQTIGFTMNDENEKTFMVTLIGSGNYDKCRSNLSQMMKLAKAERLNCDIDNNSCPMALLDTHFIPFDREQTFVGLGEFFYTSNAIVNLAGKYNKQELIRRTRLICSSNYDRLLALFSMANKSDENRVLLECFKATWIETFLSEGLNVPTDYGNLSTIGQIKGNPIDWTLGAALDNSRAIDRSSPLKG